MIEDILPVKAIKERYHSWKEWPALMREKTKGLPVVFSNSYQRASKYWFYSGQMTYSQNLYKGRRNNYNFWPVEDSMLGKPVYLLDKYDRWRFPDSMNTPVGWIGFGYDSSLASFAKVKLVITESAIQIREGAPVTLTGTAEMPPLYHDYITAHPAIPSKIIVAVFNKKGWIKDCDTPLTIGLIVAGKFRTTINPGLPKGKYYLRFAISAGYYYPTHNSEKIELLIE